VAKDTTPCGMGYLYLYKGLQVNLMCTVISQGVYFWLYSLLSGILLQDKSHNTTIDYVKVTFLSGSISSLVSNPLWLIATRVQLSKNSLGLIDTVMSIHRQEGIKGFFKGVLPNLILVLNPIINFVLYESIKQELRDNNSRHDGSLSAANLFMITSFSKSCATCITYPILTLRVRLQSGMKTSKGENIS
jgi:hypothetical protein